MSNCCVNCFSDQSIITYIKSGHHLGDCDFCGSESIYICDCEDVGTFIYQCLMRKYEDCAESIPYETREGGYIYGEDDMFTLSEIVIEQEEIFSDNLFEPYDLISEWRQFDNTLFVRQDPFGDSVGGDSWFYSWDCFCEMIKTTSISEDCSLEMIKFKPDHLYEYADAKQLLEEMFNDLVGHRLKYFQKGNIIYRARITERIKLEHQELTSPPKNFARANRMSKAGDPLFYGGLSKNVCIREVRPNDNDLVAIARFELLRDLYIIDLSYEEKYLSVFDVKYSFGIEEHTKVFLNRFVKEISKQVDGENCVTDYIPTQWVTKYIRNYNKFEIKGMFYRSSVDKNGTNIVLFKDNTISSENPHDSSAWLLYKDYSVENIKYFKHLSNDESVLISNY